MKTFSLLSACAVTVLLLSGCATAGGSADAGASASVRTSSVYYDNFYGPVTQGHWGVDGSFYYKDSAGTLQRDRDAHFRKDVLSGYTKITITR